MRPSLRFSRPLAFAVVPLALTLALAACRPEAPPPSSEGASLTDYDAQARDLLAQMTLAEKIGQMTQAELVGLEDPSDVATLFLGSVLSGGGGDPAGGNSLEAWTDAVDALHRQALGTRLGIPLLYGIDAVHGHSNVLGAVVFPHNIGLGATRDSALVAEVARITALEVRATGINWDFAPCVAVPRDIRWGRTYEGFSEDPELVGRLGAAVTRGLQGPALDDPLAVLASAKHYVGDGGTAFGTGDFMDNQMLDQGDTQVDEQTLRDVHIAAYLPSIAAGVGTIMPSYSSWNGTKVSGDAYLLTDVLKNELGFEGFLISDYNAIDQVDPDYKTAIEQSINAGMDMAMVPNRYREFIRLLTELVEEGRVPTARIDDAVTRILRVKIAMGMMKEGYSPLADRNLHASFGSAEHRAVAREAVRRSLVLLKNEGAPLPADRDAARIHVAGKNADDLGNQCGGWTIDWQGASGPVTPGGTTILEGIREAVSGETEVTFSLDGTGAEGADLGIVVVGETPYAEGLGDRTDLSLDAADRAAVAAVEAAGIPFVVVVISGRPLILGDVLDRADAVVAAWLPGTEGGGVADVLFGGSAPTGRLPFAWPASMDGVPYGSAPPLFDLGYGLTY